MPRRKKVSTSTEGMALVTGPGVEGRSAPNLGAAISLAQHFATRTDAEPGTWYIRDPEGVARYYVTKQEGTRIVLTVGMQPAAVPTPPPEQ